MLRLKILKISRKHDFVFKNKDLTVPSPKPSSIRDTSVTGSKSLVIKTSLFKPKSNQQFDSIKSFRCYPVVAYAMCYSFQQEWIYGQSLHMYRTYHPISTNVSKLNYPIIFGHFKIKIFRNLNDTKAKTVEWFQILNAK